MSVVVKTYLYALHEEMWTGYTWHVSHGDNSPSPKSVQLGETTVPNITFTEFNPLAGANIMDWLARGSLRVWRRESEV